MKKFIAFSALLLAALLCFSACKKSGPADEEAKGEEAKGDTTEDTSKDTNAPKSFKLSFESDFIREAAELTLSPDGTFELTGGYKVHEEKSDLELYKDADFDVIDYFVRSKYTGTWTEKDGSYTLTSSENLIKYEYDPTIKKEMISYLDVLGTQSNGYYAPGEYEAYVNMEYISKEAAGSRDYKMVACVKVDGDEAIALDVKELDKNDGTLLKQTAFKDGKPVTFTTYFRANQRVSEIIYIENGKHHHKESYSSETGELLNTYYFNEYGEIIYE